MIEETQGNEPVRITLPRYNDNHMSITEDNSKRYRVTFTVENAFEVVIKAESSDEARKKFEAMYAEDFEEMDGCEFVDVDHNIQEIEEVYLND